MKEDGCMIFHFWMRQFKRWKDTAISALISKVKNKKGLFILSYSNQNRTSAKMLSALISNFMNP